LHNYFKDLKINDPSIPPKSSSDALSGWGIRPNTFPFLFIIPAMYLMWSRDKKHRPEFDEPETLLKMETQINE